MLLNDSEGSVCVCAEICEMTVGNGWETNFSFQCCFTLRKKSNIRNYDLRVYEDEEKNVERQLPKRWKRRKRHGSVT